MSPDLFTSTASETVAVHCKACGALLECGWPFDDLFTFLTEGNFGSVNHWNISSGDIRFPPRSGGAAYGQSRNVAS